ncbi:MAG: hypothetical protein QOF63_60, partial [Thermoanaerobaculia bacterium]|nr:hypothetical protein [Thermoanaerobaculia bacterium]
MTQRLVHDFLQRLTAVSRRLLKFLEKIVIKRKGRSHGCIMMPTNPSVKM